MFVTFKDVQGWASLSFWRVKNAKDATQEITPVRGGDWRVGDASKTAQMRFQMYGQAGWQADGCALKHPIMVGVWQSQRSELREEMGNLVTDEA